VPQAKAEKQKKNITNAVRKLLKNYPPKKKYAVNLERTVCREGLKTPA
jgi:hypothetical protein